MITLEKIDYVIGVTGESYADVRRALLDSNGDVDEAITLLRDRRREQSAKDFYEKGFEEGAKQSGGEKKREPFTNQLEDFVNQITDAVKEIWKKGNASRLVIENKGETVLSLSLAVSAISLVITPLAALLGLSAAVISNYDFKIIMNDGEVIDVKEYIKTMDKKRKQ